MRARLSSAGWYLILALCGDAIQANALAGEFFQLPSATLNVAQTNARPATLDRLNHSSVRKDGLKQLEEELGKSLQSLSPKGSMDGVLVPEYRPPPVTVAPSKRAKEQADRNKNWMFADPEDMGSDIFDKGLFKQPGTRSGQQENKKSPMELFYEKLSRSRQGDATSGSSVEEDALGPRKGLGQRNGTSSEDDTGLPSGIKTLADKLKKEMGSEGRGNLGPAVGHTSFADFFGFGQNATSADDSIAHRDYMDKYRQLLDGNSVPAAGTTPNNALTAGDSAPRIVSSPGLDSLSGFSRSAAAPITPGSLNSFLNAGTLPDRNASVLNEWNPLYAPTRPEPLKSAPVVVPSLEIPRRKF